VIWLWLSDREKGGQGEGGTRRRVISRGEGGKGRRGEGAKWRMG